MLVLLGVVLIGAGLGLLGHAQEKPMVVATTGILGDFVRKIAEDRVELFVLIPGGMCPAHSKDALAVQQNAAAFQKRIEELAGRLLARAQQLNVQEAKVISQAFQAKFVSWLGFPVIGTYPPPERVSAQLLPYTSGQVRVLGRDVARWGPQLRSTIGYVPQEFQFDETTPVLVKDVVLMGRYGRIGLLRRPTAEDHALAYEALELLGLAELAERPIWDCYGEACWR